MIGLGVHIGVSQYIPETTTTTKNVEPVLVETSTFYSAVSALANYSSF